MKTLSVLFTIALFIAANRLAAHLKHMNALPANTGAQPANNLESTDTVRTVVFKI